MNIDKKMQIDIIKNLGKLGSAPISTSTLKSLLNDYDYPNNKIASLTDDGYLIRLRKGLYAVSPEITGDPIDRNIISNNMYGPSYISYHSALYYYGLIPEAVIATTAVTFKNSKSYITPLGSFKYYHVPMDYYSVGYSAISTNNEHYIIALREKALCDLFILNKGIKLQSKKSVSIFLEHDMRVDMDQLAFFDTDIIDECINVGIKKKELSFLKEIINDYK